jgi:hypothetical protein
LTATRPSFLSLPLLACHDRSIASNSHNRVIAKKTKYTSGRRPKKRTPDTVSQILDTKAIETTCLHLMSVIKLIYLAMEQHLRQQKKTHKDSNEYITYLNLTPLQLKFVFGKSKKWDGTGLQLTRKVRMAFNKSKKQMMASM